MAIGVSLVNMLFQKSKGCLAHLLWNRRFASATALISLLLREDSRVADGQRKDDTHNGARRTELLFERSRRVCGQTATPTSDSNGNPIFRCVCVRAFASHVAFSGRSIITHALPTNEKEAINETCETVPPQTRPKAATMAVAV
jgi:hypothetical protein